MVKKLRVLDLFSGIGGFSLGLERTGGFETVAFCEYEGFPRAVLAKHWPNVPCFPDVRKLKGSDIDGPVDVICGGYPCQPFSTAGQRRGKEDDRHLWPEFSRLVAAPAGRLLFQLAPLAHRTDATEFGLLPTPTAQEAGTGEKTMQNILAGTTQMTIGRWVAHQEWKRKMWPTPSASDNRDRGNLSSPAIARRKAKGKQIMLSQSVSPEIGALNPTWVEWLMGFPEGWTDLKPSEMPSSRKFPK